MSDKETILQTLETIARLLELQGENPFKVRAYLNAVRALETAPLSSSELSSSERLLSIEGIGKAIAEKIVILATTGKLPFYEELKATFPSDILTLFEIQGLGAKKIKILFDSLRVASIPELEAACRDGRIAALPGFGAKTAENLLKGIAQHSQSAGQFCYGDIAAIAHQFLEDLRTHPDVTLAQIAGSFRRCKEIVRDLDFIVSTKNAESVSAFFVTHPLVENVLAHGATKSSVMVKNGIQCDLRAVKSEEFPFALNYFTGSKEHNVHLRSLCLQRGWSLNEYQFSTVTNKEQTTPIPAVYEEADIYRALGLEYIPPELRENLGEIEAASQNKLPTLVELSNLRGTFHIHTTASDGRNSLEEMISEAQGLGLAYIGIADHSKSSVQAHGLDEVRLKAQIQEITALNQQLEGSITVFTGTECDILKDGTLDFSDEILAGLDYVVAAVHSSFTLSEAAMTKRIILAMENPYVTMIAHLTGRLLLQRDAYAVDIPAILDAAASTGTILELNASSQRCDLDWRWWPLAKEKGVKCVINTDAHSLAGLQNLYYGVGIARKGWLTRADVINCQTVTQVRDTISAKKLGLSAKEPAKPRARG